MITLLVSEVRRGLTCCLWFSWNKCAVLEAAPLPPPDVSHPVLMEGRPPRSRKGWLLDFQEDLSSLRVSPETHLSIHPAWIRTPLSLHLKSLLDLSFVLLYCPCCMYTHGLGIFLVPEWKTVGISCFGADVFPN